jgi:hypothetical protein
VSLGWGCDVAEESFGASARNEPERRRLTAVAINGERAQILRRGVLRAASDADPDGVESEIVG